MNILLKKIRDKGEKCQIVYLLYLYLFRVYRGYRIYNRLKKSYGIDAKIIYCPHHGTGDIYVISQYLPEYIRQQKISKWVFLFRGKAEKKVSELFPDVFKGIQTEIISDNDFQYLAEFRAFMQNHTDLIQLHHFSPTRQLSVTGGLEGYKGLSMTDMYLYAVYNFYEEPKALAPQFNPDKTKIDEYFKMHNLIPGKTVVIAPYSNSVSSIDISVWKQVVLLLKRRSYSVCTNSSGDKEPPLPGTIPIFFDYKEAVPFMDHAGYFISVRNGLCDIVSSSKCKKVILYPYEAEYCPLGKSINYVGVENMGLCHEVSEIEWRKADSKNKKLARTIVDSMENKKNVLDCVAKEVKISVIVPAYNGEEYIRECLKSIMSQTLKEIEIIIVDNGSTDITPFIIGRMAYEDDRIKVLSLMPNRGVSFARNTGIEQATGKYIAFCDCDDTIPVDAYEKLYLRAEETNADVVIGNYQDVLLATRETVWHESYPSATMFQTMMSSGTVWNKLYRTKLLMENQIRFPSSNHMEDNVFLGVVFNAAKIIETTPALVYNYIHRHQLNKEERLTKQYDEAAFRDSAESIKALYSMKLNCTARERFACYLGALYYLRNIWINMNNPGEQERAFLIFKDLLKLSDWKNHKDEFEQCFHMTYSRFLTVSYANYMTHLLTFSETGSNREVDVRREPVDLTFCESKIQMAAENGEIGLRYIMRLAHNWLKYKKKNRSFGRKR